VFEGIFIRIFSASGFVANSSKSDTVSCTESAGSFIAWRASASAMLA
jgi:hypothetical protein